MKIKRSGATRPRMSDLVCVFCVQVNDSRLYDNDTHKVSFSKLIFTNFFSRER